MFSPHKFRAKPFKINFADVKRLILVIIVDSYINRVADNIIDALHQRGIVGMKDTRVHHIVNRADGILLLALAVQLTVFDILEHAEQLTRDDAEALARICIAGKCIRTILHRLDSCKAVAANGGVQIKRMRQHQLSDFVDNCTNLAVQLANIRRGVNRNSPAGCVVCQCLPKRFHNADVVNY